MARRQAVHRHWTGHLLLSESDGSVRVEGTDTTGRYQLDGDHLTIFWDQFPKEEFLRQEDLYVFLELIHERQLLSTVTEPWIQIAPLGNLANQMIQYLVADRIQSLVPGSAIHGFNLPSWNLVDTMPFLTPLPSETHAGQFIPIENVAARLRSRDLASVVLAGYFQRHTYFPPLARCREIFRDNLHGVVGFGDDVLVINIRAGEILSGEHHHYTLVPVDYYREIISTTGLKPVFMGQVDPGPYRTYLQAHFPDATFVNSRGPFEDFQIIRRSANIVLSVSTFSWLAAWLSNARKVFMPLTGFYNPFQNPEVDFLPLDDSRYVFHLFPINYAVPVEALDEAHALVSDRRSYVTASMLRTMLEQCPRFGAPTVTDYDPCFDSELYLETYDDVREAMERGEFKRAFEHFFHHGHREKRMPFEFDEKWYGGRYPDAASEVGRGDFACLRDHYILVGHARGYAAHP